MRRLIFAVLASFLLSSFSQASPLTPDWSATTVINPSGRPNPYGWDQETLALKTRRGLQHALQYPVTVTGFLMPAKETLKILDAKPGDPLFGLIKTALSVTSNADFKDFKGFWNWLGLHPYPDQDREIPYPNGSKPNYPMGVSFITRGNTEGITLSCATCHSGQLFGKPVLGLTNRFSEANLLFVHAKSMTQSIGPGTFALFSGANRESKAMYIESRERMQSVGVTRPQALGLDTSLAQVALSLSKRSLSPWAEIDPETIKHPRPNLLDQHVADSKPAVWWNLKYKTRWLSDGSVVSGNPILTNFLWNEIGRGADLKEINQWINQNSEVIEELTTAVFANPAPQWQNFLPESSIHVERAKRGEALFVQNCARCHGQYEKAWNVDPSNWHTVKVTYHSTTPVVNVGTDPGRAKGMQSLAEGLNPLAFSQAQGIVIEEQNGYIPPPLEGIFARYPYFHNNSIPNLCVLMMKPSERPRTYTSGEAIDPNRDFDQDCVGYPVGAKTPREWTQASNAKNHLFDTSRVGLSNAGHYSKIFTNADESERYTPEQKQDLIEFLKTL